MILNTILVLICAIIVLVLCEFRNSNIDPEIQEEARLTTLKLIEKYKYKGESHFTTTPDGYILQMHRITQSPKIKNRNNISKPILLMHGLPASSSDYILMGPNISLGYLLSDLGYDVWMGNARGNRYSLNHTTLSIENSDFWNFTWNEIGIYDIPTMIDYILNETKLKKLSYIGHSQGTTAFFVMGSERPEYLNKISHMQALSPVVFLHRTNSRLLRLACYYASKLDLIYLKYGPYQFLPNSEFLGRLGEHICEEKSNVRWICSRILFELSGYDDSQLLERYVPVIAGHLPAGSSNLQAVHYSQLIDNDRFAKFDYGENENMKKYGSKKPPEYNLKNITIPIALHYSDNDAIIHPNDIERLRNLLPNSIGVFKPPLKEFNHIDYLFAKDVRSLLYNTVVQILETYA